MISKNAYILEIIFLKKVIHEASEKIYIPIEIVKKTNKDSIKKNIGSENLSFTLRYMHNCNVKIGSKKKIAIILRKRPFAKDIYSSLFQ
jgi:hypothetical protein